MTLKQFRRYLDRDWYCLHCGETEAVSPQHRKNRGMGGSKLRDVPSNIIVLCSELNFLITVNHHHRQMAHSFGWHLESWEDPLVVPVWDATTGRWYRLDDSFNRLDVSIITDL